MKKIITIILALIMTLFSVPNQGADQPPVTAKKNVTDGDNGAGGASTRRK